MCRWAIVFVLAARPSVAHDTPLPGRHRARPVVGGRCAPFGGGGQTFRYMVVWHSPWGLGPWEMDRAIRPVEATMDRSLTEKSSIR